MALQQVGSMTTNKQESHGTTHLMLPFPFHLLLGFGILLVCIFDFSSFHRRGTLLLHGSTLLVRVNHILDLLIVRLVEVEPSRYHAMQVQNRSLSVSRPFIDHVPAGAARLLCNLYIIL